MNKLTLAVAGGRKTQGVVDACSAAEPGRRILVLTYTQANQRELKTRLAVHPGLAADVRVQGWFGFLMSHWIRPYLPRQFSGRRLHGLNFDGDPGRYATGDARYLDRDGCAYKLHLARLAVITNEASGSAALDRLCRMYDQIFIDEVQDLNGYDLEVLDELLQSQIALTMVGDVRQALVLTNPREPKNAPLKRIAVKRWFDAQAAAGHLQIEHSATTWRSNQTIADFADSIFDSTWGFQLTTSMNDETTGHDGLFVVHPEHLAAYTERYQPMCLRHSANSARAMRLPFINFGIAKGQSTNRVLIAPTAAIASFLEAGEQLDDLAACSLYVAVTRARNSVAFVSERGQTLGLQVWTP